MPNQKLFRIGPVTSGSPVSNSFVLSNNINLQVSAIKVDPNTTDSVWVAFSNASSTSTGQTPELYVLGGASSNSPTITQLTGLSLAAGYYISSIDVEKGNSNHLIVTVSNYGASSVFESKDKGTTWTSIDDLSTLPDIPVRWGIIVPSSGNVGTGGPNGGVMIATDLGVWSTSSTNGTSTTWTQNAATMGNVRTDMLKLRSSDGYLVAATHGRGLFSTILGSSALGLSFISFDGLVQNNDNSLQWKVENEVNNKGFEIERQYPGELNFTSIGFVPSNTSSTSNQYQYIDNYVDLGKSTAYYRLKQTGFDGQSTYSKIISLNRKPLSNLVAYIAVNGNNLYLRMNDANPSEQLNLQVMDMSGRMVINRAVPYLSQNIDISKLAKGIYVLKLSSSSGLRYVQKFLN